ncbi:MAG TPA: hypothetical protein VN737_16105 [Bryobacteraceae bacterium]|jgi:hypothetical protein|nr:hypothetical protein [Bryobacteraceae bacterium]
MKGIVAVVLVALFSWAPILPLFASDSNSPLPACCRKAGKHHCAQQSMHSPSPDRAASVVAQKCPLFPHNTTPAHVESYTPSDSLTLFAGLLSHPAISAQAEAGYRISFHRSRQKRGPPTFLPI